MIRMRPQRVRTRLALWHVAVLGALLLIYGGITSAILLLQLRGQLDRLAIGDLETVEAFLSFDSHGKVYLRSADHDHPYPGNLEERLMEVWSSDGELLYRNESLGIRSLGGPPEPGEGVTSYSARSVRLVDGTRVRVVSRRHRMEGRPVVIRLGLSEEDLWQRFWQSIIGLLAGLLPALGLAGLAGYLLSKHALRPVEHMARRAHEINAERLGTRLDVENPEDELGRLAAVFNDTLARLERSFEQLRRFTSDASHELRTPLAAIRTVGEMGLRKNGSRQDYREAIGSMLEEAGRLTRLVDTLLTIARADSGQMQLILTPIRILPFVRDVASMLEVLAEEKSQIVTVDGDDDIEIETDQVILGQVLVNLLDNAVKYSPPGGRVSMRVRRQADQVVSVEVEDSGPGIPASHRANVFDRFYRVDDSRARESGGAGLGLAIAKWGAEAHGGSLEVDCPGESGCVFRLLLPCATRAAANATAGSPDEKFIKGSCILQ